MKNLIRNLLALIVGLTLGSAVNMSLILLGPVVIPPPPGVDMTSAESMAATMHLFEPRHFIFPFLAHALGTLVGATAAFLVAASRRSVFAWMVAAASLAGGIAASFMIPAPTWFVALDLVAAYIPMGWMATRLGERLGTPR